MVGLSSASDAGTTCSQGGERRQKREIEVHRRSQLAVVMAAAIAAFSGVAHGQVYDGNVEAMALDQLTDLERILNATPKTAEEQCSGATAEHGEDAVGDRYGFCVERTARYTTTNPGTSEEEIADIVVRNWVTLAKTGDKWVNNLSVKIVPVQGTLHTT